MRTVDWNEVTSRLTVVLIVVSVERDWIGRIEKVEQSKRSENRETYAQANTFQTVRRRVGSVAPAGDIRDRAHPAQT